MSATRKKESKKKEMLRMKKKQGIAVEQCDEHQNHVS